ncbi:hypothetical protein GOY07_00020 [Wolbachia endosymbiont of Litomosoides sigmodontis]|uniref:transposase n=1 Tax=Wolbachia endosymbiont of Litomosoides sigmodontis TaxID=80850 RepID=UPI0015899D31|nr:hypothetical protein GOY07_00020 [Wolbachia endosymbiont of Litomosoides sigmodontis]
MRNFFYHELYYWYKSKNLKVTKNIEIVYLPLYALKLNPIEKLWFYIKQNILCNKVYNTIALLGALCANLLPLLSYYTIKQLCNVTYLTY